MCCHAAMQPTGGARIAGVGVEMGGWVWQVRVLGWGQGKGNQDEVISVEQLN